jgi:hypothetical protein
MMQMLQLLGCGRICSLVESRARRHMSRNVMTVSLIPLHYYRIRYKDEADVRKPRFFFAAQWRHANKIHEARS